MTTMKIGGHVRYICTNGMGKINEFNQAKIGKFMQNLPTHEICEFYKKSHQQVLEGLKTKFCYSYYRSGQLKKVWIDLRDTNSGLELKSSLTCRLIEND